MKTAEDKLNRDLQKRIAEMRRFAFEEQDAPVIEAQQRIIESATEPLDPVILAVDVGCVRYKRVLGKMIEAEQQGELPFKSAPSTVYNDTSMSAVPQRRMNVDEFLAWAEAQPGRYELFRGSIYAMTPERAVHAEVKLAVQTALADAIRGRINSGAAFSGRNHGTHRGIDRATSRRYAGLLRAATRSFGAIELPNPAIALRRSSPFGPRHIDAQIKLAAISALSSH